VALTPTIATAIAAVCATVALGGAGGGGVLVPAWALALGLLPGVVLAGARPQRPTPATHRQMRLVVTFTGVVALLLYLGGGPPTLDRLTTVARLGILSVLPLSLLWPAPTILRYCLLISAACLLGAGSSLGQSPWPVAGLSAGTALALVALNRMTAMAVPTLAPTRGTRRRRIGSEAILLLAVAGLAGLLLSALLQPPARPGGGGLDSGKEAGPGDTSPYLNPNQQLDAGAEGSGKGDKVLLRISAPAPSLWRTQTFDHWDGRTWSRSPTVEESVAGRSFGQRVGVPPGIGDSPGFSNPFVQRVRVEAGSAGLLVAAPRPVLAALPSGRTVRVSRDGTMRALPALGKGATYVVTSTRSTPTPEQLRESDFVEEQEDEASEVFDVYVQLPSLPAPVRDLAAQLTGNLETTYDKAKAVEDWLFSNAKVGKGTGRLPRGAEPVERFLFVDKAGSAEQAASAMAVMLRSLDIPARVAVGFLPGDRYALGGEFVVRQRHAHAWVEVWFEGSGWVAFDPSGRGADVPPRESLLDRLRRLLGAFWWVLAIVLAVTVRWLTRRAVRWWQRRRARPWVTRCYARVVRSGRAGGRPRAPPETPAEYCAALAEHAGDSRLAEVGEVLTAAAYSGRDPGPERRAWVDQVVRETAPRLRGAGRRLEKSGRR
jgi:transglutaminase-like putative cysteine protease